MSILKRLKTSFATALGLGVVACGPLIPENSHYKLREPSASPANGTMTSESGFCNYGLLDTRLAVGAKHCAKSATMRFVVFKSNGSTSIMNERHFMPSAKWTKSRDVLAPQEIRNDFAYKYFARDKAIFELNSSHDENIPFMEIAPLGALTWRPTADPMVQMADVKMMSHVTDSRFTDLQLGKEGPTKFYELSCHAYLLQNVNEIFATDCPAYKGMSGSTLYTETTDGRRLAVAVLAGWISPYSSRPLHNAFKNVVKTPNIHIASTLESFIRADLDGPDFETVERKRTPLIQP